jgi:uncharacterized protein (TIGR02147 family)
MNIFTEKCYREVLRRTIAERKRTDHKVNFQNLADKVRIPKSYLSKVIHGKADLNTDQLFLISNELDLSEEEQNYLQLLLEYARCGVKKRRDVLGNKIEHIRKTKLDTREYVRSNLQVVNSSSKLQDYYLDPVNLVVHIALAIPRYQNNLILLAKDLGINLKRVTKAVRTMEKHGIIEQTDVGIKILQDNFHLTKESEYFRPWKSQLRGMAAHKMENADDDEVYSFSAVFSANEETRKQIQQVLLRAIKDIQEIVGKSTDEDVYQLNFDLFPWSK